MLRPNPRNQPSRTAGCHRPGAVIPRWLPLGVLLFTIVMYDASGRAENRPADQLAFEAAVRDFDLRLWERAARELAEFEAKFPKSAWRGEAAERRGFAQAEAAAARGEAATADLFAQFQHSFPATPRAGLAAVREAGIRLGQAAPRAALDVLGAVNGPFVRAVAEGREVAVVFRGLMIQAAALVALKEPDAAEAALVRAAASARAAGEEWERLRLLLTVQDSAGRLAAATDTATKLRALAEREAALSGRRAEAVALAGRLWLRRGDTDRAVAAFEANAVPDAPVEFQREAVWHLVELHLDRRETAQARARLEAFVAAQPADRELGRVRLRLGQILFREYGEARTGPAAGEAPALLVQAAAQFQAALTNSPAAELAGPLLLARGWTLWEEGLNYREAGRVREAATNFLSAAATLPHGADQAVARFKAADSQFWAGDAAGSLTNYLAVLDDYADVPTVAELIEPAAGQAVLAGTQTDHRDAAERAMTRLLAVAPGGAASARSTLLLGQALARTGDIAGARNLLQGFLQKLPSSPQRGEVELMLGTVELRARNWTNALGLLGTWLAAHTNHPSAPRAEFDRAWAAAQAGQTTNAMAEFAALAARYPTNVLALTAQLWLADNYFRQGDFTRAEQTCVALVANPAWSGSEPWHRARFWAAEAARKRQSFGSAGRQLLEILNDKATPTNWVAAAFFTLGELRLEQPPEDPAKPLGNVSLALEAFAAAAQITNAPQAAPALGKMADCQLQLASQNTNSYARAAELYQRALDFPGAELAVRCKAAAGLGLVQEKRAQRGGPEAAACWRAALDHYLDVAHGKLGRPGEAMDPWWVRESGRSAGQALEALGQWRDAAALYDWLAGELPAQQAAWRARAEQMRQAAGG